MVDCVLVIFVVNLSYIQIEFSYLPMFEESLIEHRDFDRLSLDLVDGKRTRLEEEMLTPIVAIVRINELVFQGR